MRYKRFSATDYVVFGLLAIGLLSLFVHNPGPFIIPLLVFGGVFLLYKFPPGRFASSRSSRSQGSRFRERDRRKSSFRVIPGKKDAPDEEPPKYH